MLTILVVFSLWVALYFFIFAISRRVTSAPITLFMFGSALCFWSAVGVLLCLYLRCSTLCGYGKKGA